MFFSKLKKQRRYSKKLLAFLVFIMLACLLIWQLSILAANLSLSRQAVVSSERVKLYQATLENALNQLDHLPLVVASHQTIVNLLENQEETLAQARAYIGEVKEASGADVIYVLDGNGKTVASSNWREKTSFEGRSYGFRPYFSDAMSGKEGRFFAVGVTTKRPGYFISRPVFASNQTNKIIGVVVVKIELEALQKTWHEGGEKLIVLNEDGIIVSTSNKDWIFKTLAPLKPQQRQHIKENRTFYDLKLEVLNIKQAELEGRLTFFIDGDSFLAEKAELTKPKWTIYYLASLSSVKTARLLTVVFLSGGLLFAIVFFLYQREKLRQNALKREAEEARKIRRVNKKLEAEIDIRKKAEADLYKAQEELVLASKMAALGKMSAAIAHEVNQPISAIKTFAASGKILLEREKINDAQRTLEDIIEVTERLSAISGDLKLFARTSGQERENVSVYPALERVLKTFKNTFSEKDVSLILEGFDEEAIVFCPPYRLEQVFSNIIQNALDAMERRNDKKELLISMVKEAQPEQIVIRFQDTGKGIAEEMLEQLFVPFVTTKPVEQGVGLGLAISYGLIEEMGGSLRARNHQKGGAVFSIRLPIVCSMKEAAE